LCAHHQITVEDQGFLTHFELADLARISHQVRKNCGRRTLDCESCLDARKRGLGEDAPLNPREKDMSDAQNEEILKVSWQIGMLLKENKVSL
jgi:hypothetical protein